MTEGYLLDLLPRLTGDMVEIYSHPGTPHAAPLPDTSGDLDVELHALLSTRVRERCRYLSYNIASYLTDAAEPARSGILE